MDSFIALLLLTLGSNLLSNSLLFEELGEDFVSTKNKLKYKWFKVLPKKKKTSLLVVSRIMNILAMLGYTNKWRIEVSCLESQENKKQNVLRFIIRM